MVVENGSGPIIVVKNKKDHLARAKLDEAISIMLRFSMQADLSPSKIIYQYEKQMLMVVGGSLGNFLLN